MPLCNSRLTLRPYRLLCAVCALGEDDAGAVDAETTALLERLRAQPDMPVSLYCNTGDLYRYQDPGTDDDTPGGAGFNLRRDLEILLKLDLFPGCTMPARTLFYRLLAQGDNTDDVCGYAAATSGAWAGCPKARSGCYQRGHAKGIDALFSPRTANVMTLEKQASLEAMRQSEAIRVRPHILVCAVCQYGQDIRPPYPEDNLPELLALVLQEPDRRIMLALDADWMMCAPCPYRGAEPGVCVIHQGEGGLANPLRDLRVMQKLGLMYGDVLPARELFQRIFDRIAGTLEVCRLDHAHPSIWRDPCGVETADSEAYARGKALLSAALGLC